MGEFFNRARSTHNIVSEAKCNPNVTAWHASIDGTEIYLSILVANEVIHTLTFEPKSRSLNSIPSMGAAASAALKRIVVPKRWRTTIPNICRVAISTMDLGVISLP